MTKAADEKSGFPPRVSINFEQLGYGNTEYLSTKEHEAIVKAKVAEAWEDAAEQVGDAEHRRGFRYADFFKLKAAAIRKGDA